MEFSRNRGSSKHIHYSFMFAVSYTFFEFKVDLSFFNLSTSYSKKGSDFLFDSYSRFICKSKEIPLSTFGEAIHVCPPKALVV